MEQLQGFTSRARYLNNHVAKGLQTRLYQAQQQLSSPGARPNSLANPSLEKLRKHFEKKTQINQQHLAEFANRDSKSLEVLTRQASIVQVQLLDLYRTLVHVLEYRTRLIAILNEAAALTPHGGNGLSFHEAPWFVEEVFEAILNYYRVHYLVFALVDRKAVVTLCNLAHFVQFSRSLERYEELIHLLVSGGDDPLRLVIGEFREHLGSKLEALLCTLLCAVDAPYKSGLNTSSLISQSLFNPCDVADTLSEPSELSKYLPLMHLEKMNAWICVAILISPDTLLRQPSLVGLLQFALTQSITIPLFRDKVCRIHDEFQEMLAWIKPRDPSQSQAFTDLKLRKVITDTAVECASNAGLLHRERRVFLAHSIRTMIRLFSDTPGLLGPKAPMAITALTLARAEVLWHFNHLPSVCKPPKAHGSVLSGLTGGTAKYDPGSFCDPQIGALIGLILQLLALCRSNGWMIVNYTKEYIAIGRKNRLIKLKEQLSHLLPATGTEALNGIIATCTGLAQQSDQGENISIINELRDCGFRFHDVLVEHTREMGDQQQAGNVSPSDRQILEELRLLVNTMTCESLMVDQLEEFLQQLSSLGLLHFHSSSVEKAFEDAVLGEQGEGEHSLAFVASLNHALDTVHPLCPEELDQITKESTVAADKRMGKIQGRMAFWLTKFFAETCRLHAQLSPQRAALRFEQTLQLKRQTKRTKEDPSKWHQEHPLPGFESRPEHAQVIRDLTSFQTNLQSFSRMLGFSAMTLTCNIILNGDQLLNGKEDGVETKNDAHEIIVCDRSYRPREYLRETVEEWFRMELVQRSMRQPTLLERPSVLLDQMYKLISVIQFVSRCGGLDHSILVKAGLLDAIGDIGGGAIDDALEQAQVSDLVAFERQRLETTEVMHQMSGGGSLGNTNSGERSFRLRTSGTSTRNHIQSKSMNIFRHGGDDDQSPASKFSTMSGSGRFSKVFSRPSIGSLSGNSSHTSSNFDATIGSPIRKGSQSDMFNIENHVESIALSSATTSASQQQPTTPSTPRQRRLSFESTTSDHRFSSKKNQSGNVSPQTSMCEIIAAWFTRFVESNLCGVPAVNGIVFSKFTGGFVRALELQDAVSSSRWQSTLPAEYWMDKEEFTALASLVGGRGIRIVDIHLLSIISQRASSIKAVMENSIQELGEFRKSSMMFDHEMIAKSKCILKLDTIVPDLIALGNTLAMRDAMFEAARNVLFKTCPDISNVIHGIRHYSAGTLPESNAASTFAGEKIPSGKDVMLQGVLQPLMSNPADMAVWELLPFAISASMTTPAWKSADIILRLEASRNNAHVIAIAAEQLISSFPSRTGAMMRRASDASDPNEDLARCRVFALQLLNSTSAMLLCMKQEEKGEFSSFPLRGMFLFLEYIVKEFECLTYEDLERVVPYALVHSAYLNRSLGMVLGNHESMSANQFSKMVAAKARNLAEDIENQTQNNS